METANRRPQPALSTRLQQSPEHFQALQLLRLLQQLSDKPIRVSSKPQLGFVAAEIDRVQEHDQHLQVNCNAAGLFGTQGCMPVPFTEELIRLQKLKQFALRDFLNIINNRYFQLLLQSWRKHRPALLAEQNSLTQKLNPYQQLLEALCGISGDAAQAQVKQQNLGQLQWAGHWSRPVRTAAGLKQYLAQHFELRVNIEQFIPSALALSKTAQSKLSQQNSYNNQLGMSSVLGQTSWQLQYCFAVHIQIRDQEELHALQPDSKKLAALQQAIAFYCGPEQDFSIKLSISDRLFNNAQLRQQNRASNQLGWGMQLKCAHSDFSAAVNSTTVIQIQATERSGIN